MPDTPADGDQGGGVAQPEDASGETGPTTPRTESSGGRRGTVRSAWRGSSAFGMTGCRGGITGEWSSEGEMEGEDPDHHESHQDKQRHDMACGEM